jgi:protein-S-isoprenylcysteine O-methyltransferase Ste14
MNRIYAVLTLLLLAIIVWVCNMIGSLTSIPVALTILLIACTVIGLMIFMDGGR